ncbi:MAG TPA: hypothetical protein VHR97_03800 [Candidatus Baltobacteraceae bacterium]|nr:hypothetical protein [Candidatus Baltobacteraceae bacterium]
MRPIGDRVGEAFRTIAAPRKTRAVAILVRVDVKRHDPRRVAGVPGLSDRQFFREQRLAHDAFFAAYNAPAAPG